MTSHDQIEGIPVREIQEATTAQGDSFVQKAERSADASTVEREFKLANPYRRGREDKRREECAAAARILKLYNQLHDTDYDTVSPDPEDRDADVIVSSSSGSNPDFRVQVVTEGSDVWRNLAQSAQHVESSSESNFLTQLEQDLLHKETRADPKILLVYEGPGVITVGTLDKFATESLSTLQRIKFREIWYCSRAGSVVKRLKG
jgi:hypothetical protein